MHYFIYSILKVQNPKSDYSEILLRERSGNCSLSRSRVRSKGIQRGLKCVRRLNTPCDLTAGKRREICICRLVSRFYEEHLFTRITPARPFSPFAIPPAVVHRYANSSAISSSIGCNEPSRRLRATLTRAFEASFHFFSLSQGFTRCARNVGRATERSSGEIRITTIECEEIALAHFKLYVADSNMHEIVFKWFE